MADKTPVLSSKQPARRSSAIPTRREASGSVLTVGRTWRLAAVLLFGATLCGLGLAGATHGHASEWHAATANPPKQAHLSLGDVRVPPSGWLDCAADNDAGCSFGAVTLSSDLWDDLYAAQYLNETWTYRPDKDDDWTTPDMNAVTSSQGAEGDCEDVAMAKLTYLRDLGWPEEALRLAIGTRNGEDHAALLVRTTSCDLILDNKGPVQCATRSQFKVEKINVGPFWRTAKPSERTLF